jgi:hypothetical protein
MEEVCVICKSELHEVDGDLCVKCSAKYRIEDDTITIGKIRKKKREE